MAVSAAAYNISRYINIPWGYSWKLEDSGRTRLLVLPLAPLRAPEANPGVLSPMPVACISIYVCTIIPEASMPGSPSMLPFRVHLRAALPTLSRAHPNRARKLYAMQEKISNEKLLIRFTFFNTDNSDGINLWLAVHAPRSYLCRGRLLYKHYIHSCCGSGYTNTKVSESLWIVDRFTGDGASFRKEKAVREEEKLL